MLKCYNLSVSSTTLDLQFWKLVTMTVRLLLVLPTPVIGQGSSHCMIDCNMGQHGPSIYEQYCCISSNKGKIIRLTESDRKKIIFCPSTKPSSCPRKISIYCLYFITISTSVSSGNSNRL